MGCLKPLKKKKGLVVQDIVVECTGTKGKEQ
jgi:hypothetical protein